MKKPSIWERYLTREIGIEFKACLYFFAILFYYCCFRVCNGLFVAEILHMTEMILLTYGVGYAQVYLLWNFDEAEHLGLKEIGGISICTIIYAGASYVCKWFDGNIWATIGFVVYIIITYICVFLIYKCRRRIDDKILNSDLELFKARSDKDEEEE